MIRASCQCLLVTQFVAMLLITVKKIIYYTTIKSSEFGMENFPSTIKG